MPVLFFQGQPCCGLYDPINKIESARLYGNIDAYAYYFVDLQVGTPPQRVSVILDTGSRLHGFPCTGCKHCGRHMDPAFNFSKSTTAAWMTCGECAMRCDQGRCAYRQGYTEGSSISGYWFKDYVFLGDAIQHNPPVMTRIGCHQNEDNLFYTQEANGILGVGPGHGGQTTLLQDLFRDRQHVQNSVFSICFAEWGGRLVVGGYNKSYHTGPIQRIALIHNGFYNVQLTGMRINGEMLSDPWGNAMIDSGTTYSYMGSGPYRSFRNAIERHCRRNGKCGLATGTCWSVNETLGLVGFPTVEVIFGGTVVTDWVPKSYLYRKKGKSKSWCYAIGNDGVNANTVLGASWMLHKEVIFDISAKQVGIVNAQCPEYKERPPHRLANVETPVSQIPSPPFATASPSKTTTTTKAPNRATSTAAPAPAKPTATSLAPAKNTHPAELPAKATPSVTPAPLVPAAPQITATQQPIAPPAVVPQPAAPALPSAPSPVPATPQHIASPAVVQLPAVLPATTAQPSGPGHRTAGGIGNTVQAYKISFAVVGVLLTCTVGGIAFVLCCRGRHRHARLDEDAAESGLPPQIVGSVHEHEVLANHHDFIVGGEDEDHEENWQRTNSKQPLQR